MLDLITGGAGFLGINLVRHLLARGHSVRSLDLAPFDYPERGAVEAIQGDIRDPATVERVMAGSAATGIPPSAWLTAFCVFLFFSLAMIKRYAELVVMRTIDGAHAHARAYELEDTNCLRRWAAPAAIWRCSCSRSTSAKRAMLCSAGTN